MSRKKSLNQAIKDRLKEVEELHKAAIKNDKDYYEGQIDAFREVSILADLSNKYWEARLDTCNMNGRRKLWIGIAIGTIVGSIVFTFIASFWV